MDRLISTADGHKMMYGHYSTTNLEISKPEHEFLKAYVRWTLGLRKTYPATAGLTDQTVRKMINSAEYMLRGLPTQGRTVR